MKPGSDLIQKTVVLVKPDGVQRGLCGAIVKRFEKVGVAPCRFRDRVGRRLNGGLCS